MKPLNFPQFQFRFQKYQNKIRIFSRLRKKFLILTPEEWVRQHCVHYLLDCKKYSAQLMAEEVTIKLNGLTKRCDIVTYYSSGDIKLIVECKAPEVKISQNTFDQIARYNMVLDADFLMITNGLNHYFCKLDLEQETYTFLKELPEH
jgi:hypothetical protein